MLERKKLATLVFIFCTTVSAICVAGDETEQTGAERLLNASKSGDVEAVRLLVKKGVDVNSTNEYGLTPLYYAADRGWQDVVDLLIESGAKVEIPDEPFYRLNPMIMAARKNHAGVVRSLLNAGATCEVWTATWPTSLGHTEVVKVLVELRPKTYDQKALGQLLAIASQNENDELQQFLLERGAVLPKIDQTSIPEFNTLSAAELQKLDGVYRNPTDMTETRLWVRDGKVYFGPELDLAIPLQQTDNFAFTLGESSDLRLELPQPLGSRIDVIEQGNSTSFVRDEAQKKLSPNTLNGKAIGFWPRFRGVDGAGNADGLNLPIQFDVPSNEGLLWKTLVPGVGHSSPVVWGDKIILTTAVALDEEPTYQLRTNSGFDTHEEEIEYRWLVICLDLATGDKLWETELCRGKPVSKRHIMSSNANSTPAIDEASIVVNLAGEGVYCLSHDGEIRWKRNLGRLASGWFMDSGYEWGFASSPVIHEEKVILQCDVFEGAFLTALRLQDGSDIWRVEREELSSWGTPLVVKSQHGFQVVANGTRAICGYKIETGEELWRVNENSEITVASPVLNEHQVLVTGGYKPIDPIFSIDPDARGDITQSIRDNSEVAETGWFRERGGAYLVTPLVYRGLMYFLQTNGVITCLDSKDGSEIYKKRLASGRSGDIVASPIAADGNIYIAGSNGDVFVLAAGASFERPTVCPIGEPIMASPAAARSRLIIRGQNHVFCLAQEKH